jgi:hypothetical protein
MGCLTYIVRAGIFPRPLHSLTRLFSINGFPTVLEETIETVEAVEAIEKERDQGMMFGGEIPAD